MCDVEYLHNFRRQVLFDYSLVARQQQCLDHVNSFASGA